MDAKLLAWARAVKARRRHARVSLPPLWLFSDWHRLPDSAAVIRCLPPGLCGLVHRPSPQAGAAELRRLRQLCRAQRVVLSVAGDSGLAGCGEHRAAGRKRRRRSGAAFATASAHDGVELVRAERAGAALVFLSPVFPTASHPAAASLGVLRWAALTRQRGIPVLALGGVNGRTAAQLPRFIAGAGAIGAMLPLDRTLSA